MVPNVKISSSTLSERGTATLVCTPHILAGSNLEAGVTSLMRRTPEACSWRLNIFAGGYAVSDGEGLPHILTPLLMMMEMVATGPGPRLLPVSPFCTMKTVDIIISSHTLGAMVTPQV